MTSTIPHQITKQKPAPETHHLAGDCVEGMAKLKDESVDLILMDPPYSSHTHSNGKRGHRDGPKNRVLGFEHLSNELLIAAADQVSRICRRWVLAFCDIESIHAWKTALETAGLEYVRACFWSKSGAAPQFTGDRPGSHVEAIVCAHRKKPNGRPMRKRWNGRGRNNVFTHPVVRKNSKNEPRIHTAQKPVSLVTELVTLFSDPGDLVVDPFAGVATTGVACQNTGRVFMGWEMDKKHHAAGVERCKRNAERLIAEKQSKENE